MTPVRRLAVCVVAVACLLIPVSGHLRAQSTDATITGIVTDPSKAIIRGAKVDLINVDTGVHYPTITNGSGIYSVSGQVGNYRMEVEHAGFRTVIAPGIVLHTQDALELNFEMAVGSASESVTVHAGTTNDSPIVSTVVDKTLIENMPLNGKDLTTLFELSPGTILNAGGQPNEGGGFSVDGQRPTANYLTIDGTSGNSYMPITEDPSVTGATIATSASGGTNGILPIDAIEEYRMDTSTYTAESGRTPGGQIQVRTRSGTNAFHGTLFENFRNQILDATDWFVKYDGLKQAQLRMNDFGGTFGGPLIKNRLFFFVAHDTLLMNQPNTLTRQDVPDQALVQNAYPIFKTWMAVFPAGNGGPDLNNPGFDFFSSSYPDLYRDHTTSIRLDTQLPRSLHAFFRANIAPSTASLPSIGGETNSVDIYTYTGGLTVPLGPRLLDELTVNHTSNNTSSLTYVTQLGGNTPDALKNNLPAGVTATDSFYFYLEPAAGAAWASVGPQEFNALYQWNIVDKLSWEIAKHSIRYGVDFLTRQSSVKEAVNGYTVGTAFESEPPYTSLQDGTVGYLEYAQQNGQPVIGIKNASLFVNDNWRYCPSLTLNLGLRWEYNPAPSVGPLGIVSPQGSVFDPTTLTASVSNQPLYSNRYDNLAPRFGFSWSVPGQKRVNTVIRGGAGIYFDTGQASVASEATIGGYPYQSVYTAPGPVSYQSIAFPTLTAAPRTLPVRELFLVDTKLLSPRTYEWSLTLDQSYGNDVTVSLSYVGNDGERLVGQDRYYNALNVDGQYTVNPNLVSKKGSLYVITNQSHSNYQALQAQLTSRIGSKLVGLISYTWGHAEDNGSTDFTSVGALAQNPLADSANDLRQIFAAAIHYAPSALAGDRLVRSVTGGWALDTIALLQTAYPFTVDVSVPNPTTFSPNADVVSGHTPILHEHVNGLGQVVPGNKLLNFNAFTAPPEDSSGAPLRQGDSATNGYRLFGLTQWDVAANRTWKIWEGVNLTFRVDAFNLLNTANFSEPNNYWCSTCASGFGEAQDTYAGANGASAGSIGVSGAQLNSFQNGGPRELQLSMKLKF